MMGALKKNRTAYLFILPLVVSVSLILLYPVAKAALMSVQYWMLTRPISAGNPFVGFDNYRRLFASDHFMHSVRITAAYIIVTVAARYVLGLATAILLNVPFKGRGIVRALIIIPWALPEVVTCLVFILMTDYQYGVVNDLLIKMGLLSAPVAFLGSTDTALGTAMLVNIWKGFPFAAIMLLAGLQTIPQDLYEAAKIDGASAWRRFRHITLPMLRPVSVVVFLLLVIWTVKDFGIIYVLAQGGPSRATEVLTIFIYKAGFRSFDLGLAAAGGMVLLAVSILFTVLYLRMMKAGETT